MFHILDTLFSKSYEVLVPGQVSWNFLLFVLREMGQIGQVRHGISTALHKSFPIPMHICLYDKTFKALYTVPHYYHVSEVVGVFKKKTTFLVANIYHLVLPTKVGGAIRCKACCCRTEICIHSSVHPFANICISPLQNYAPIRPSGPKQMHYENMPIQIYWKFHHQKLKVFR